MGKRELLLIAGFIVLGALAYQFTAPAARPGESRFSLSNIFNNVRREMRGNPASVTITRSDALPVTDAISEVRISGVNGKLEVRGEARTDIAYELQIESNGPDDATARSLAERVTLRRDDLGSSLALRLIFPREARQRAGMVIRVPARLAVRLDGGSATVSQVGAVHLEGVVGDATVSDIERGVTGTHRNGELKLTNAASASLTLVSSNATISGVRGTITLNARNGECTIEDPKGAIEIDENNQEVTIRRPAASVRVTGSSGRITIERPRAEVRVDARRAEVEVTLDAAVPVTALTTDDTLRLLLDGPPSVVVDAVATEGGTVQARDFELDATVSESEQHLAHAFGAPGGARVSLRNQHGEIVIRKAK